jgi:uncharacterized membrane protein AbrB (regulator of aidB expression)
MFGQEGTDLRHEVSAHYLAVPALGKCSDVDLALTANIAAGLFGRLLDIEAAEAVLGQVPTGTQEVAPPRQAVTA